MYSIVRKTGLIKIKKLLKLRNNRILQKENSKVLHLKTKVENREKRKNLQ